MTSKKIYVLFIIFFLLSFFFNIFCLYQIQSLLAVCVAAEEPPRAVW